MNLNWKGLVKLENNVNFRKDLILSYLSELAILENRDEFDKFYPMVENYIQELAQSSKDLDLLNKIKNIISFKTKKLEMNI